MIRSIVAVIVAYIALVAGVSTADFLISVLFPHSKPLPGTGPFPSAAWLSVLLFISFLFATLGGYICALLARRSELAHGLVLGIFLFVLGLH